MNRKMLGIISAYTETCAYAYPKRRLSACLP